MSRGVNVVALVKDNERYIFMYDQESRDTMLRTLGRFAADTELSFTWYDAAVLTQKIRQTDEEHGAEIASTHRPRVPR